MLQQVTMQICDLNSLYIEPAVNQISRFADRARELDIDALGNAYINLVERAPKRSLNKKQYFQTDHNGFPSGDGNSNRREEHLALALFNQHNRFDFPGGRDLNIVDYQTPLKSRQGDKGIGKIDLFGIIDNSIPAVIELKIHGIKKREADTPLRALLEGLAYCAIVEANIEDITDEAKSIFNLQISHTRPDLIVMAPNDYWRSYLSKPSAGDWLPVIETMITEIRQKLHLNIHLCSLLNAEFEMGSSRKHPALKSQCHLVPVGPEIA
jgi:hypothetical protein